MRARTREQSGVMRLLYVCHAPPCPPALGPARRHYPIVREASKRHDVTLVSFGTASDERRFHEHLPGACRNAVFVDMRRCLPVKAAQRAYFLLTGRTDFRRLYAARFQRAIWRGDRCGAGRLRSLAFSCRNLPASTNATSRAISVGKRTPDLQCFAKRRNCSYPRRSATC